jgi:hypothetical protein
LASSRWPQCPPPFFAPECSVFIFLVATADQGPLTDGFPVHGKTYGYRENLKSGLGRFFILPSVLESEILTGFNVIETMKYLRTKGHLALGENDRLQMNRRLPGFSGTQRVYAIKQSFFDDTLEGPTNEI